MNPKRITRNAALLLTLAASLLFPTGALAADSGSTTETLNIPAEYVLQNVPATITYRAASDGAHGPSDTPLAYSGSDQNAVQALSENSGFVTVTFASSFGGGTALYITASDLTGGYPGDIPTTNRKFYGMGPSTAIEASSPILSGAQMPVDTSTGVLIATWNGTSSGAEVGIQPVVTVPGGSVGEFTGTLTFSVVGLD